MLPGSVPAAADRMCWRCAHARAAVNPGGPERLQLPAGDSGYGGLSDSCPGPGLDLCGQSTECAAGHGPERTAVRCFPEIKHCRLPPPPTSRSILFAQMQPAPAALVSGSEVWAAVNI